MENASKALLMAGGVLLVMLIIALVIFAWSSFSDFYNSGDELAEIEDLAKFNEQFTNYDRNDVYGYELLSLANKVADYNSRYSNAVGAQNDKKYSPITLEIDMSNKFKTDDDPISYTPKERRLFTSTNYKTTSIGSGFSGISQQLENDERNYGKENLQNWSKAIDSLFVDKDEWNTNSDLYTQEKVLSEKTEAIKKFNYITRKKNDLSETNISLYTSIENCNYNNSGSIEQAYNKIKNFKEVSYKYYEYTQFKKAKFNSKSSAIIYDDVTGRIKKMVFTFTGKVG